MKDEQPIRILLADDHVLFREGLASIVNAQPDMTVVGEADDGLEALVKAKQLRPDLVLIDISMPGGNGLEATQQIKEALPDTVIVVLTVHNDEERLFEAIRSGAQGYLLKDVRSETLLDLVRGAMRGEAAITPVIAGHMLDEFRRLSRAAPQQAGDPVETLTFREQEVLTQVATGAADKEIAEALGVSLYTVKSHMRSILSKLHVNTRYEAARYARRKGLL
ncbi:MAG: response regulator transcription factor [Anaerolineae bacterium]|nr:response regulator transcription factor [Anaerolineae bacterium]